MIQRSEKSRQCFPKGGAGCTNTHGERGTGRAKAPGDAWELEHIHRKLLLLDLSDAVWLTSGRLSVKNAYVCLEWSSMAEWGCCV